MSRELIYAAHPMSCYGTAHERRCLEVIEAEFPRAELVNPADHFADHAEWLRSWPRVLDEIDSLVAFADADGWIGRAMFIEITDATLDGVPVCFLNDDGEVRERAGVWLPSWRKRSLRHFARLSVPSQQKRRRPG